MAINKKQADALQYIIECAIDRLTAEEVRGARRIMAEARRQADKNDRPTAYMVQDQSMIEKHGIDHFELKFPKDLKSKYSVTIELFKGV